MGDCRKEFATLVKATLSYLQEEWSTQISHRILNEEEQDGASDLLERAREYRQIDKARVIEGENGMTDCLDLPKVCEKTKLEPLKEPPPPKSVAEEKKPKPPLPKRKEPKPSLNWILNPMPLPTEFSPQFTSFFKAIPLNITIRLFVTDPSQTFFLESVARAITQLVAPAALFSGKLDTLLTNHNIQLVLAPLSLLIKRFPQVQLHQFLKLDGPTLLPLADHYDIDLKRTLWNSLKNFQNMLPSS